MGFITLNKKGQMAVEFMLLIVIILLYLQGVIQPNLNIATEAINDTTHVGQARLSAEKLVNAINSVSSSTGESKQTVHLFIPQNSEIICNSDPVNTIVFEATIQGDVGRCVGGICTKTLEVIEGTELLCNELVAGSQPYGSELTDVFQELRVYKDGVTGEVKVE